MNDYTINSAPFVRQGEGWKQTAHRLATELAAARANSRDNTVLLDAAKAALAHLQELRDAWQRGVIDERDNFGGRRSNRNVDVEVALRHALDLETSSTRSSNESTDRGELKMSDLTALRDAAINLLDGASDLQDNGLHYVSPDDLKRLRGAVRACHESRERLPANFGKPWATEEDAAITLAFDGGMTLGDIARKHLRTLSSVRLRLEKLGKIELAAMDCRTANQQRPGSATCVMCAEGHYEKCLWRAPVLAVGNPQECACIKSCCDVIQGNRYQGRECRMEPGGDLRPKKRTLPQQLLEEARVELEDRTDDLPTRVRNALVCLKQVLQTIPSQGNADEARRKLRSALAALKGLADAADDFQSSEPDMPSHRFTTRTFERALTIARDALADGGTANCPRPAGCADAAHCPIARECIADGRLPGDRGEDTPLRDKPISNASVREQLYGKVPKA